MGTVYYGPLCSLHCTVAPLSSIKNVFRLATVEIYCNVDKSASFRCNGRLVHSLGPAAANALSPKVLYVRVTTHVRLAVERSLRSSIGDKKTADVGL